MRGAPHSGLSRLIVRIKSRMSAGTAGRPTRRRDLQRQYRRKPLRCQRYERGSTIVTSNLPFDEWTGVFGSERLTGALLDRLTHHVHILEMNGDSYRLKQSKRRQRQPQAAQLSDKQTQA